MKNLSFFLPFFLFLLLQKSDAQTVKTWTGSVNSNWNNSGNWNPSGVPGSGHIATFTTSSSVNCNIDISASVAGINITGTYSGIITQNSGINIALVTGGTGFSQSTGTFVAGSGNISITDQNFSFSGGTFTGGSGNITILGLRSSSRGSFIQTGGTFTAPSGFLYISSNFTHTAGGTFNHNNGTVYFREYSNSDSYIDVDKEETFYNLTLLKGTSARGLFISSNDTVRVMGTTALNTGWLQGNTTPTSGYLDSHGDVTISPGIGSNKYVVLRFRGGNNQDFDLTGATALFDCAIVLKKTGGELKLISDVILNYDYDSPSINPSVTLSAGTLNLNNKTFSAIYNSVAGNVTINGVVIVKGPGIFSTAFMTQNGGEITFPDAPTINVNRNFILNGGEFTSTSGNLNVGLNWTNTGGTFNHNFGTVRMIFVTHTNTTIDVLNCENFQNLVLDKTYTGEVIYIAANDKIQVEGTLSIVAAYIEALGTGFIKAYGDVTVGSLLNPNNKVPILFSGSNTQNFDLTGATAAFDADILISKSGGSVILQSNLTMNQTDQDLVIGNGTLDLNGKTLTVTGTNTTSTRYLNGVLVLNGGSASPTPTYIGSAYTPPTDPCKTPLPVTLISFDAARHPEGVALRWSTATETDNDYFDVHRSLDGKNWKSIGKMDGNGNSNSIRHYWFLDKDIPLGEKMFFYRLKQIDFNKDFEYSGVVIFRLDQSKSDTKVFFINPNPAGNVLNIHSTKNIEGDFGIKIMDLGGKIVLSQDFEKNSYLNIEKLIPGFYLLQIFDKNGSFSENQKFRVTR